MKHNTLSVSTLVFCLLFGLWRCSPVAVCDSAQDCQNRGYHQCQAGKCVKHSTDENHSPAEGVQQDQIDAGSVPEQTSQEQSAEEQEFPEATIEQTTPEPIKPKQCDPTQKAGTFGKHTPHISSSAFSPDGTLLATNPLKDIQVWEVDTQKIRFTLKGHTAHVHAVSFSPNGKWLASASEDKTVKLWDLATGTLKFSLEQVGHSKAVTSLAFTPDGTRLASASKDGTVRQWDVTTGRFKVSSRLTGQEFTSVAFTPNGKLVAASSWNTGQVWVWDAKTMKRLYVHSFLVSIYHLAFATDSQQATISTAEKDARLFDIVTGKVKRIITGHRSSVFATLFSRDGKSLFTASYDGLIKQWSLPQVSFERNYIGHLRGVNSLSQHPTKPIIASTALDKTIRLWDYQKGQFIRKIGSPSWWNRIAFSPDGTILASSSADGSTTLWLWPSKKRSFVLRGHTGQVSGVSFHPTKPIVATASLDGTVKLWSTKTGTILRSLQHHFRGAYDVAFHPDGNTLASAGHGNEVYLWDPSTGKKKKTIRAIPIAPTQNPLVYSLAFHPNGQSLFTGGSDKVLYQWDLNTQKQLLSFKGYSAPIRRIALQSEGKILASTSGTNKVRLWDLRAHKTMTSLVLPSPYWGIYGMDFQPGSTILATGGNNGQHHLWDARTGREKKVQKSADAHVQDLVFHPHTGTLISADNNNLLTSWQCPQP